MQERNRQETEKAILENTAFNLNSLIERLGTDRVRLAERLHIDFEELNECCDGKKIPDYYMLLRLKDLFGLSVDDILMRKETPEDVYLKELRVSEDISTGDDDFRSLFELNDPVELKRLAGTYFAYYLDTENYKGKDNNSADTSMNYGVLKICEAETATGIPTYDCVAMLGKKDRDMVAGLKKDLEDINDGREAVRYFFKKGLGKYVYYGNVLTSKDHYYITLIHESEDRISVILHRPNTRKNEYIGGIGTTNSVSRGRQHMPTVQFIGLSRLALNLSEEDIHKAMLLSYPNYHAGLESDELIRTFKNLYMNDENTGFSFNDTQRQLLIQSNLERIIKESLTRNLLRYAKVSEIDDDEWYHTIKYYGIKKDKDNS
ncbi:MAG: hypothetical protein IKQ88_02280 [Lachnospiraceae bacterium]|nr:hypothetical protein [Lachnospiraceae bacterium]